MIMDHDQTGLVNLEEFVSGPRHTIRGPRSLRMGMRWPVSWAL